MLPWLLPRFSDVSILFNLFNYLTFRAGGAVVTALLISFVFGPAMIRRLRSLKVGQVVRHTGPQTHLVKAGTPTMGGLLIVGACTVSTLLWADLRSPYVGIAVGSLLYMGALGFLDDWLKIVRREPAGLIARYKLIGQGIFGIGLGWILLSGGFWPVPPTATMVPFFSDVIAVFWPPVYVAFVAAVTTGTSNAVNISDGLDGLCAGLSAIATVTIGVFAYLIGRIDSSAYLGFLYLPGTGELAVFAVALAGACLGFLWFNAHPAQVFMGDTGSLAIGGALGVMAILLKVEFLLAIVGGVFVIEALSTLIQTGWFRYTRARFGEGRRVFRMAPIHHHFEKLGWLESTVVVRFWIVGILFALLGFSTLKIR